MAAATSDQISSGQEENQHEVTCQVKDSIKHYFYQGKLEAHTILAS
jgi:hypothetical protein